MKLRRLWQPRRALFWQFVAFNVFSSLCSWALRSLDMNTPATLFVGALALLNLGFGLWAGWQLLREEPPVASGRARTPPTPGP